MKRTLLILACLTLMTLPNTGTNAQDDACEIDLTPVYVLVLQAQVALDQGNNGDALVALSEARAALESIEDECGVTNGEGSGIGTSESPEVTIFADGSLVTGTVQPATFCTSDYKIALYAKTDIWYVQPFADARRDIQINADDCTWEATTHNWNQLSAHLVEADFSSPDTILVQSCPPLNPATNSQVIASACFQ